jgi:hypothetical protein
MQTIHIALEKVTVIEAYLRETEHEFSGSPLNGHYQVDIHPLAILANGLGAEESPAHYERRFSMDGSHYPPGSGKVSSFRLVEFFEDIPEATGNYNEVRAMAIHDWLEAAGLAKKWENGQLSINEEEEMESEVMKWMHNAYDADFQLLEASVIDRIVDDELGIEYVIHWE